MGDRRFLVGAIFLISCAHGGDPNPRHWSDRIEPDLRYRDHRYLAVVRLGESCSGILITSDLVLTAAHCVPPRPPPGPQPQDAYPAALPQVLIGLGNDREVLTRRRVDRCWLHPSAYPGVTGCAQRPDRAADHRFDTALLRLDQSVPSSTASPLPVLLNARGVRWRHRRARLVGWHARPRRFGALHRYSGLNQVLGVSDGVLTVESPGEEEGFSTHRGNSGGPALIELRGQQWVVGVLSRATHTWPRRSRYVATFAPDVARFIERVQSEVNQPSESSRQ